MNFLLKYKKIKKGFGMLEVLIGVSIMSLSLIGLVSLAQNYLKISKQTHQAVKATFLLEESLEAVKLLRDDSWQNNIATLSSNTDYFIVFDGASFKATTTYFLIDNIFERKIILADVFRGVDGRIVLSSGVLDNDTKKVTAEISWMTQSGTTTKSLSTYITNILE